MNRVFVTAAAVAVVALTTLALDGMAYASTGSSMILGKLNTASTTTVLQGNDEPVLSLRSSTSTAVPLEVNGTGRVTNLNADRLDSLEGAQLQRRISLPCPSGQSMIGAWASGAPRCADIEPQSTLVTLADRGPFDDTHSFTAPAVSPGRYTAVLTADLIPALRGSETSPKRASCTIAIAGTQAAYASANDAGAPRAASVRAVDIIETKGGPLTIACGFERGTWSFGAASAPRLLLTPVPSVISVSAS
jgi:hypothetical protein